MNYPDTELYNTTTVGRVGKNENLIYIHPDNERKKRPYFRFYDSDWCVLDAKVALISMIEATYEEREDNGHERFKLNAEQKKELVEFLNAPSHHFEYKGFTNWQTMILLYNREVVSLEFDWKTFTKQYKEEHKVKFSRGYWRYALPIDLEMPDYSLLSE